MKYRVVWPELVQEKLIEFLTASIDGVGQKTAEINVALTAIIRGLQFTPERVGESRDGRNRVMVAPPITVEYYVENLDHAVVIIDVHYSRGQRL